MLRMIIVLLSIIVGGGALTLVGFGIRRIVRRIRYGPQIAMIDHREKVLRAQERAARIAELEATVAAREEALERARQELDRRRDTMAEAEYQRIMDAIAVAAEDTKRSTEKETRERFRLAIITNDRACERGGKS